MSRLKDRIISMIRATGPMPVNAYMDVCLHDPKDGYYSTRPGLGQDFITAPEISQIFGELLGLWAAHEWQAMGAPKAYNLCEIGPGRGTLMSDALRATKAIEGFDAASFVTFIEPSPVLREALEARFEDHHLTFNRHLAGLTPRPSLILANEWLDCLPAKQFTRIGADWYERVIGLNDEGDLTFGLAADKASSLPASLGDTIEVQVGLESLIHNLKHLDGHTWRLLAIDYGPATHTPGDTLRAYKDGQQVHPLAYPGESDLTVDVDFSRLKNLAEKAGLAVRGPVSQGEFLMRLGAQERLNTLIKSHPEKAESLFESVQKLVDPAQMGSRFNVICISHPDLPDPTGI